MPEILAFLLYADDFCLIAISPFQMLSMMQTTKNWRERNRLTVNAPTIQGHCLSRDPSSSSSGHDPLDDPLQLLPLAPPLSSEKFPNLSILVPLSIPPLRFLRQSLHQGAPQVAANHLIFANEATPNLRTGTLGPDHVSPRGQQT